MSNQPIRYFTYIQDSTHVVDTEEWVEFYSHTFQKEVRLLELLVRPNCSHKLKIQLDNRELVVNINQFIEFFNGTSSPDISDYVDYKNKFDTIKLRMDNWCGKVFKLLLKKRGGNTGSITFKGYMLIYSVGD